MLKNSLVLLIGLAVLIPYSSVFSAEDKAINLQRRDDQRQRQLEKNERNTNNNDALRAFRDYAKPLKKEYQQKSRDLDTEFKLLKVEMKAEHDSRIAIVEAEFQQSLTQLMMNPPTNDSQATVEKYRTDMKTYSDKVFAIKKQAATEEHEELIKHETNKQKLMSERDKLALDKAQELGLQKKFTPILAKPIGDGLTSSEKRWNDREIIEVDKLYNSNQRQLGEFVYGAKLREWSIENKREDFALKWKKLSELHELNGDQTYFNVLYATPSGDQQADAQAVAKRMSELSKQTRLINIKYKKINDQNRIRRQEQKKKIMGL